MNTKVKEFGESIAKNNNGAYALTITQAAAVAGEGANRFAGRYARAGFLIKPIGTKKMVNVFDLAEYLLKDRISPVDNARWKGA